MVKHIVFYRLLDPTQETKQKMIDTFLSMKDNCPTVVEVNAGADFYKSSRSYDVALEVIFNSKEDLDDYKDNDHYHHTVVQKYVHSIVKESASVDYEF